MRDELERPVEWRGTVGRLVQMRVEREEHTGKKRSERNRYLEID